MGDMVEERYAVGNGGRIVEVWARMSFMDGAQWVIFCFGGW